LDHFSTSGSSVNPDKLDFFKNGPLFHLVATKSSTFSLFDTSGGQLFVKLSFFTGANSPARQRVVSLSNPDLPLRRVHFCHEKSSCFSSPMCTLRSVELHLPHLWGYHAPGTSVSSTLCQRDLNVTRRSREAFPRSLSVGYRYTVLPHALARVLRSPLARPFRHPTIFVRRPPRKKTLVLLPSRDLS